MKREKILSEKKINQVFQTFDMNGDGFISREEWSKIMGGLKMNDEEWTEFLEGCDGNNDGKVSF